MTGSAPVGAVAPFLNQQCVPQLWSLAFANAGISKSTPFSTQLTTYGTKSAVLAQILQKRYPKSKVAFIYQVGDLGNAVRDGLTSALKGSSVSIVSTQSTQQTDTSVQAQMTTLIATKTDVLVFAVTGPQCTQILDAVGSSTWRPHVFDAGGCTTQSIGASKSINDVVSGGDVYSVGQFKSVGADATDPDVEEYLSLAKQNNIALGNTSEFGYINAYLTVQALEQAKKLTRVGIADAAQTLETGSVPLIIDGLAFKSGSLGTPPITQQSLTTWSVKLSDYLEGPIFGLN